MSAHLFDWIEDTLELAVLRTPDALLFIVVVLALPAFFTLLLFGAGVRLCLALRERFGG